jgi:uncharacterized protein
MEIPSDREIESLHKKYTPNRKLLDSVYTHCQIIEEIAVQLIEKKKLDVDKALVRAACLLHDLGVYALFDREGNKVANYNYMYHGIRGEELIRKEGLASELARIASHHLGLGFTEEDIRKQGLPFDRPYLPETKEERLVTYADKFHSKTTPPRFDTYESFKRYAATFDPEIAERFEKLAEEFGIPNLEPLIKKYGHEVK